MHRPPPWVTYTAMRLTLFLAAVVLLSFVAHGAVLLVLAFLVSGLVSMAVLSRQRDQMSGWLFTRVRGFSSRLDVSASAEDDADDAWRGGQPVPPGDRPDAPR